MSMTYNSLVNQIKSYINRTDADTIAQIPNAISLTEQRISREANTLYQVQYVTGNFEVGNPALQKPGNWRRTVSINYGSPIAGPVGANILLLRDYEFLLNYWPIQANTAPPLFYADYGPENFLVAPTPDQAYPFQIAYLQLPPPLNITNQTNILTQNAPDALLYGSIWEMNFYLKNWEILPYWKEQFNRSIDSLNGQNIQRQEDRSSNRNLG